jgi:CBS domain-containing protein
MANTTSPAPSVIAGIRQAYVAHAPFANLRDADLDLVVRATSVRYYATGEIVLSPSAERPKHCYFVRQGSIRGEATAGAESRVPWEVTAGEMFPLGPLLTRRGPKRIYKAMQDTFLLVFPASVFDTLLERSSVFADYCTRTLSHLLQIAQGQLQAEYAAAVTEQRGTDTPLNDLPRQAPITVEGDIPAGDALRLMEERRIGSLPIVDAQRRPVGIFTRQDVVGRIVLPQRPLTTPIRDVASAPVVALPGTATAADAALAMASHGIRHIVVVDDSGAVAGVVSERDLFGLQRLSVRELHSDIRRARDVDSLRQSAADVRALSHALVAQGVGSAQLTRLIASLNDQIVQRLLDLTAGKHALQGITVCWLGMGSEGRGEQTIASDQDNGLIFEAEGVADEAARERLLPFAREVNHALDALGYPLCKGGVMAMNPRWCASLAHWRTEFATWIDRGDPESLLAASIFFDFRPLWGEATLAQELRRDVAERARNNPRFLKQMADNALRNRPPLNWYGELQWDAKGIDLKLRGAAMIVDGARILALANGVVATNTVERLERAGREAGIPDAEIRAWADAFAFLQMLRLRTQHRRADGLLPPDANPNFVPLDDTSDLDRRILKEAMRQVRALQRRLELDYPG